MSRIISTILFCIVAWIIWGEIRERMDCHAGRADACAVIDRERANATLSRNLRGQP